MENNWIRVKDKLPEYDKDVLVCVLFFEYNLTEYEEKIKNSDLDVLKDGAQPRNIRCIITKGSRNSTSAIGERWSYNSCLYYDSNISRVSHWMELPSPPSTLNY